MLNHITLMGNLTKDVEVKTVGDKMVLQGKGGNVDLGQLSMKDYIAARSKT